MGRLLLILCITVTAFAAQPKAKVKPKKVEPSTKAVDCEDKDPDTCRLPSSANKEELADPISAILPKLPDAAAKPTKK